MNKRKNITWLFVISTLLFTQASLAKENSKGEYIKLTTAKNMVFEVYATGPRNSSRGILLIPEWWGLNKDIRQQAEKLATSGYRVMAVDLYNGKVANEPQYAKQLMQSVKQVDANAKYLATLKVLDKTAKKIAVTGSSYGGSQALHASLVAPDKVSATVMYYPYGKMITNKDLLRRLKGPVQGHFAKQDFAFTPDKLHVFEKAINVAGVILQSHSYDAKHGFANPDRKNFNSQAYTLARKRTLQFLNNNLR